MSLPSPETFQNPWILGLACLFCGIGLPVPEELLALAAGAAIASERMELLPAWASMCTGLIFRDLIAWGAGAGFGRNILQTKAVLHWIGADRIAKITQAVVEDPAHTVLLGRLTVGMRPPYFLIAGACGVSLWTMLAVDTPAVIVFASVLLGLGFLVGPVAVAALPTLSPSPLLGVFVLLVAFTLWQRRKRRAAHHED